MLQQPPLCRRAAVGPEGQQSVVLPSGMGVEKLYRNKLFFVCSTGAGVIEGQRGLRRGQAHTWSLMLHPRGSGARPGAFPLVQVCLVPCWDLVLSWPVYQPGHLPAAR